MGSCCKSYSADYVTGKSCCFSASEMKKKNHLLPLNDSLLHVVLVKSNV